MSTDMERTASLPSVLARGTALACLLIPGIAKADTLDSGDTAWILASIALALSMTLPGLRPHCPLYRELALEIHTAHSPRSDEPGASP